MLLALELSLVDFDGYSDNMKITTSEAKIAR